MLGTRVHHEVVRQIFIGTAQPVAQPRAEAGPAGDLATGLDVGNRRIMIDRLGKRRVHHAQLLGHGGSVRQQLAHPKAVGVIFVFGKFIFRWANRQRLLARGHARDALAITHLLGQILAVHCLHLRFVIPQIKMARATTHKEINHTLRLGHMMKAAIQLGIPFGRSKDIRPHQPRHRRRAQAKCRAPKQLPARHHQLRFVRESVQHFILHPSIFLLSKSTS